MKGSTYASKNRYIPKNQKKQKMPNQNKLFQIKRLYLHKISVTMVNKTKGTLVHDRG